MSVEELLVYGKQHVHSDYAKILLAELINKNVLELFNCLEDIVSDDKVELYKKEVEALKTGKPLQYVIGNVNFYGNRFQVNENVLIPRFETEELVENTIKYVNQFFHNSVEIIDLGCGSGVIGLSLEKKLSTKSVDLVDISESALAVAKQNRDNLGLKANLIHSDMWKNIDKKYDVIISNPPYIKTDEEIEDIVRDNEPHLALYAGVDGLDCYRKIIDGLESHMKEKCIVAFEIGYEQAADITNLIQEKIKNVRIEVKKDLSEKDRMLFIFKNCE
ncbi:MAG: peptide chain release factor N(5)-glutamine methyltransferase [Bacilli bacterium]|nr:peptide chain release factor N(5)-glutamine methyltransferase [Bacilli bacterium]